MHMLQTTIPQVDMFLEVIATMVFFCFDLIVSYTMHGVEGKMCLSTKLTMTFSKT